MLFGESHGWIAFYTKGNSYRSNTKLYIECGTSYLVVKIGLRIFTKAIGPKKYLK